MTDIRHMTFDNLSQVFEIVDSMHWGYYDYDIKRMISSDPEGNYVAHEDNNIVGINFSSRADDFAFIGPVIVNDQYRGKKIGEKLMVAAIDHLKSLNVKTIELDAVFPAAPLYRRLGFNDKYFSNRMRKVLDYPKQTIQKFDKSQTSELIDFNTKLTGLKRYTHLEKFCEEFSDSIYLIHDGAIKAYGLVRPRTGDMFWLGPMVAESDKIAITLFEQICGEYAGQTLALGVLETQRSLIKYLRNHNFIHTIPALRMYLGERWDYDKNYFAILAPEKG